MSEKQLGGGEEGGGADADIVEKQIGGVEGGRVDEAVRLLPGDRSVRHVAVSLVVAARVLAQAQDAEAVNAVGVVRGAWRRLDVEEGVRILVRRSVVDVEQALADREIAERKADALALVEAIAAAWLFAFGRRVHLPAVVVEGPVVAGERVRRVVRLRVADEDRVAHDSPE